MSVRVTTGMIVHAATILDQLRKFMQPADATLSQFFREQHIGTRERGFIADTAYAVLRNKRVLEKLVQPAIDSRHLIIAASARINGLSQRQLSEAITADEAQWVTSLKSRSELELSLADQADLPDWLVARLAARMSEADLLALARGLNQSAPLDLRVNAIKATREEVLARLSSDGIAAEACRYAPLGIRLKVKPALQHYPLYLGGEIEVQDEGSQLLGYLLAPKRGEMVVDFCAGAGGKTLLLGALMRSTGRLYAFDVSDKRLARLKPRVARAGLSNVHPVRISSENDTHVKRLAGKIDRVLVDAPCSGLGTLRRNPDLKWRQTMGSVTELVVKQHDILASAARLVKPGGRLVYATCSILAEENANVVADFLEAHPQFSRLSAQQVLAQQGIAIDCGDDMQLTPHVHDTDGFYAVVMERAS